MRVLVVYCHPVPESFCAAVRDKATGALEACGHEVQLIDLYAEGFDPVMCAEERRRYNTMSAGEHPAPHHAEKLKWAEALIFVYPTWWYGLPAMLKGWLDRVWTPETTFTVPTLDRPMTSMMRHVKRLGIITTCGAPRWWSYVVGHPGKRTILRGMRTLCAARCRTLFLAHYRMDTSTPESRAAFLRLVDRRLRRL